MTTTHPLPVGTHVRHAGQQWARTATAVIRDVMGPYNDGAYEYLVDACREFSRRPGLDNPMDDRKQWASYQTLPAPRALDYVVTFERIGRHGGRDGSAPPAPLIRPHGGEQLAQDIHAYARPFIASRHYEVVMPDGGGEGAIIAGFHTAGTFTLTTRPAAAEEPAEEPAEAPRTAHVRYAYSPRQGANSNGGYHLVVNTTFTSGRLRREAGDVLCDPRRDFWGLEPRPEAAPSCAACLRLAARHDITVTTANWRQP
jgi:hypothetical protein